MDIRVFYIVCVIFALFAIVFAYRLVRYKGLTGFMFSAVPIRKIGEVQGMRDGSTAFAVRIHLLDRQGGKAVGLEIIARSVFIVSRMGAVAMTQAQAELLVKHLQQAINESRSG